MSQQFAALQQLKDNFTVARGHIEQPGVLGLVHAVGIATGKLKDKHPAAIAAASEQAAGQLMTRFAKVARQLPMITLEDDMHSGTGWFNPMTSMCVGPDVVSGTDKIGRLIIVVPCTSGLVVYFQARQASKELRYNSPAGLFQNYSGDVSKNEDALSFLTQILQQQETEMNMNTNENQNTIAGMEKAEEPSWTNTIPQDLLATVAEVVGQNTMKDPSSQEEFQGMKGIFTLPTTGNTPVWGLHIEGFGTLSMATMDNAIVVLTPQVIDGAGIEMAVDGSLSIEGLRQLAVLSSDAAVQVRIRIHQNQLRDTTAKVTPAVEKVDFTIPTEVARTRVIHRFEGATKTKVAVSIGAAALLGLGIYALVKRG